MSKESTAQTLGWIAVDVATPQWIKDIKTLEGIGKAAAESRGKKAAEKIDKQLSVHKKPWFEKFTKALKAYQKQLDQSNAAKAGLPPDDIAGLEQKIIAAKKKAAKSPAAQKDVAKAHEALQLHVGLYVMSLSAMIKRIDKTRADLAKRQKDLTLTRDVFKLLEKDFGAILSSGLASVFSTEMAIYMLQSREAALAANGCLSGLAKLDRKLKALAVEARAELKFVEKQAKHINSKAYVEELAW